MTIGNISTVTSSSTFNQIPDWYTDLWQASRLGKLDEIKSIIENFNITPENFLRHFEQCVMVAGREGHKNIIDFFLSLESMLEAITLKSLTYTLDPGSEDFASEDHRKEIIDDILSRLDKDPSISPEYLHEVFKAALANNRIKIVEAIIKFIDPKHVYETLKSILEKNCIESEGITIFRYYEDIIEIIINSLIPEYLHNAFSGLDWATQHLKMNINSISAECLCKVLHVFLGKENEQEIKDVINSESILCSDSYGEAFVHAAKSSQIDIIQLFINSNRFKVLDSVYLDQALASSNTEIKQMIKTSDRVKNLNITAF